MNIFRIDYGLYGLKFSTKGKKKVETVPNFSMQNVAVDGDGLDAIAKLKAYVVKTGLPGCTIHEVMIEAVQGIATDVI